MLKVIVAMLASVTVVDIEVKHRPVCGNAPIAAFKIEVDIVPAWLVVLHSEAAVPVSAVVDERRRRVCLGNRLYRPILVSLGNFQKEDTAVKRFRLYREVDPHTETRSAFEVDSFAAVVLYAKTTVHIT